MSSSNRLPYEMVDLTFKDELHPLNVGSFCICPREVTWKLSWSLGPKNKKHWTSCLEVLDIERHNIHSYSLSMRMLRSHSFLFLVESRGSRKETAKKQQQSLGWHWTQEGASHRSRLSMRALTDLRELRELCTGRTTKLTSTSLNTRPKALLNRIRTPGLLAHFITHLHWRCVSIKGENKCLNKCTKHENYTVFKCWTIRGATVTYIHCCTRQIVLPEKRRPQENNLF